MNEQDKDKELYELYEVIATEDGDIEATIQVADNNGLSEEDVQDAVNRHRVTLGKRPFFWDGVEEEFPPCEAEDEPVTDKVINDMVVYGKTLAHLTIEDAITKAAEFLKMTKREVADAVDRHERKYGGG